MLIKHLKIMMCQTACVRNLRNNKVWCISVIKTKGTHYLMFQTQSVRNTCNNNVLCKHVIKTKGKWLSPNTKVSGTIVMITCCKGVVPVLCRSTRWVVARCASFHAADENIGWHLSMAKTFANVQVSLCFESWIQMSTSLLSLLLQDWLDAG